jgi:hypothetical protein
MGVKRVNRSERKSVVFSKAVILRGLCREWSHLSGVGLNRVRTFRSDPCELRGAATFGSSLADLVSFRLPSRACTDEPRLSRPGPASSL